MYQLSKTRIVERVVLNTNNLCNAISPAFALKLYALRKRHLVLFPFSTYSDLMVCSAGGASPPSLEHLLSVGLSLSRDALFYAALSGCVESVELLVGLGYDVNAVYAHHGGLTALHVALLSRNESLVASLLTRLGGLTVVPHSRGAAPSPLLCAKGRCSQNIHRMLREAGAELARSEKNGVLRKRKFPCAYLHQLLLNRKRARDPTEQLLVPLPRGIFVSYRIPDRLPWPCVQWLLIQRQLSVNMATCARIFVAPGHRIITWPAALWRCSYLRLFSGEHRESIRLCLLLRKRLASSLPRRFWLENVIWILAEDFFSALIDGPELQLIPRGGYTMGWPLTPGVQNYTRDSMMVFRRTVDGTLITESDRICGTPKMLNSRGNNPIVLPIL